MAFENVSFSYPGTDKKALDHISFQIPPGKTVALVGTSGSGKSTAAQLIPRFYDASEGRILVALLVKVSAMMLQGFMGGGPARRRGRTV